MRELKQALLRQLALDVVRREDRFECHPAPGQLRGGVDKGPKQLRPKGQDYAILDHTTLPKYNTVR